jgi:hypothetical protein
MMIQSEMNPYAPPLVAGEQVRTGDWDRSFLISMVSGIGAFAFSAFTVMLLGTGGSEDRTVGLMFLLNVPVLCGIVISSFRSIRISAYFALGAAIYQLLITIPMLVMFTSEALLTLTVNSAIVFPCLGIAIWAWLSSRRSISTGYSMQDGG